MPHLWIAGPGPEWNVLPLDGEAWTLTGERDAPVKPRQPDDRKADGAAHLLRRRGPEGERWLLLAHGGAAVRVNGAPVALGVRILSDRDAVAIDETAPFFFSTERLAQVAPFPGGDRALFCPRCKTEIAPTSLAVQCPGCHSWHHQDDDMPCWTYGKTCALCEQPTELQAGYRWTPEDI